MKFILFIFIFFLLTSFDLRGSTADLLPRGLNPVQGGVVLANEFEMIELFKIFDGNDISQRHYDYVSYLDGATFGMGHWHQGGAYEFFKDLSKSEHFRSIFLNRTIEYFTVYNICHEIGIRDCGKDSIDDFLGRTIFNKNFFKPYTKPRVNSLFNDHLWLMYLISYAFRDKELVRWQLDYYDRFLLEKVRESDQVLLEMDGIDSLIVLASLRSSGSSYPERMYDEIKKKKGIFKRYNFNLKPVEVPNLNLWKVYLSWKWYNLKKGKLRNRMKIFYCHYLQDSFSFENIDC